MGSWQRLLRLFSSGMSPLSHDKTMTPRRSTSVIAQTIRRCTGGILFRRRDYVTHFGPDERASFQPGYEPERTSAERVITLNFDSPLSSFVMPASSSIVRS